jgi:hypothetical protein
LLGLVHREFLGRPEGGYAPPCHFVDLKHPLVFGVQVRARGFFKRKLRRLLYDCVVCRARYECLLIYLLFLLTTTTLVTKRSIQEFRNFFVFVKSIFLCFSSKITDRYPTSVGKPGTYVWNDSIDCLFGESLFRRPMVVCRPLWLERPAGCLLFFNTSERTSTLAIEVFESGYLY